LYFNTRKNENFCSWKTYAKQPKGMGIYSPFIKLVVGPRQQKKSTVGRLPGRPSNGQKSDRCASGRPGLDTESNSSLPVDRPVDRGHFQRAKLSDGRPGRSIGLPAHGCVHVCAHRSTGPVDRLLPRSTGPVDRQTASTNNLGIENLSFCLWLNPIKSHKFHKNQFLLDLWNINMWDKKFNTYFKQFEPFLCSWNLP